MRPDKLSSGPAPKPVAAPRADWHGHLDAATHDRVQGWAWDPARATERVRLLVVVDGEVIGRIVADQNRPGLAKRKVGDGHVAFNWRIPGGLSPAQPHVVQVLGESDGCEIKDSPRFLQAVAGPALADNATAPMPAIPWRGHLDIVTRTVVAGWAWDPAALSRPVVLRILVNGQLVGHAVANGYRRDLAEAGIGDGRSAFEFRFGTVLSPTERHEIRVLADADSREIHNSPQSIEKLTEFSDTMEAMIATAISALAGESRGDRDEAAATTQHRAMRDRVLRFLLGQADRVMQMQADADGGGALRETLRVSPGSILPAQSAADYHVLVIDDYLPDDSRDAGSQAILSHMRALQALGCRVSFVASQEAPVIPGTRQAAALAALEATRVTVCGPPFYGCVEDVLRRQPEPFHVIYLHRAWNAGRYMLLARYYAPNARLIYSVADLHYLRFARHAEIDGTPDLQAASETMRHMELHAAANADAVLTHSTVEAAILRQHVPKAQVHVVPWDVAVQPVLSSWQDRHGIAFIGNYDHLPNLDAACWLNDAIMPVLRGIDSSITCTLAGSNMPDTLAASLSPGVTALGYVADLGEVFGRVRLTVAPLRYGAGLKGKVLQSLAAGIPCVMTPVAAEGLDLPPPLAALVAADPASLAALIAATHSDGALLEQAGAAGLNFMRRGFSPAIVESGLRAATGLRRPPPRARATAGVHRQRLIFTYHRSGSALFEHVMRAAATALGLRHATYHGLVDEIDAEIGIAHLAHSLLGFEPDPDCRGVRIIRDPRDIWVSSYLYHRHCTEGWCINTDHDPTPPISYPRVDFSMLHRREQWKRSYLARLSGKSYQQNLLDLEQADGLAFELDNYTSVTMDALHNWFPRPGVLDVKLESIVDHFDQSMETIFRHLGFSDEDCKIAVSCAATDDISRMDAAGLASRPHSLGRDLCRWQRFLTKDQVAAFERRYGHIIVGLGYDLAA